MINPTTGWLEMAQIPNKMSAEIADITKKPWFTCYALPERIVFDRGTKNMFRNNHQYKVGDNILVKRKKNSKNKLEFIGMFPITQINDNEMVCFQKVIINDDTNIRRIKPFFEWKRKIFFSTQVVSL